jgi:hypothetical protein
MCSEGNSGAPLVLFGLRRRLGSYRRAVEGSGIVDPRASSSSGPPGQTLAKPQLRPQRHTLDPTHRSTLARLSRALPTLPETCHRRFQQWAEEGVLEELLHALALDLKERGGLDLSECFVDGTVVGAKKGEGQWERPSGARVRSSWREQTALHFLSPCTRRVLRRMRSRS